MGYTDLWRCKRCGSMPEIVMLGKNFFVKCSTCNSKKVDVYADNIDEVVSVWNRANKPSPPGLLDRIRGWFGRS